MSQLSYASIMSLFQGYIKVSISVSITHLRDILRYYNATNHKEVADVLTYTTLRSV